MNIFEHSPYLEDEWDRQKNANLDPNLITYGSHAIANWICLTCGSSYDMMIKSRTIGHINCPYCAGKRVNNTNSLSTLRPDLAKELVNKEDGDKVTPCSHDKLEWRCPNCNNKYFAIVKNRTLAESCCPFCDGKSVNESNCLCTTHPDLSNELVDKKLGKLLIAGSHNKPEWKCSQCGNKYKAMVKCRALNGTGCRKCAGIAQGIRQTGSGNPNWNPNREAVIDRLILSRISGSMLRNSLKELGIPKVKRTREYLKYSLSEFRYHLFGNSLDHTGKHILINSSTTLCNSQLC